MPECYIAKRGYQIGFDKPLQRVGVILAIFSAIYFVNDPKGRPAQEQHLKGSMGMF